MKVHATYTYTSIYIYVLVVLAGVRKSSATRLEGDPYMSGYDAYLCAPMRPGGHVAYLCALLIPQPTLEGDARMGPSATKLWKSGKAEQDDETKRLGPKGTFPTCKANRQLGERGSSNALGWPAALLGVQVSWVGLFQPCII